MDEKTYDLYERYYHSELSEAEQANFKNKLEKEPAFKAGYIAFRKAIGLVRNAGPKPLNKELAVISAKYEKQELAISTNDSIKLKPINGQTIPSSTAEKTSKVVSLNRSWIRRAIAVAASVGILVVANFWYQSTKTNAYNAGKIAGMIDTYQQINRARANAYLESYEYGSTPSVTERNLNIFNNGMDDYSNKRYAGAIKYFKNYLETNPTTKVNPANFYLGESLRIMDNPTEALIYLNRVKDESTYYASKYNSIGIIYDASGDVDSAIEAFEKVKKSNDKEIVEEVKRIFVKNN